MLHALYKMFLVVIVPVLSFDAKGFLLVPFTENVLTALTL